MSKGEKLFKIKQVVAAAPYLVKIIWENNDEVVIDLRAWLNKSSWFAPVLSSDEIWRSVHIDEFGWNIQWSGCEMEVPSSTLWRLHQEQTGQAMSKQEFGTWLNRHKLSVVKASRTLGLSRRMVTYYKSGERIIPRTVLLACKAVDAHPELTQ